MPISAKQKQIAPLIKRWYINHLGMKASQVSVTSSPGRGEWMRFRVRPDNNPNPYVCHWSVEIPIDERKRALKVIYPNSPINEQGSAGNVDPHHISMHASEWEKFLTEIGITADVVSDIKL